MGAATPAETAMTPRANAEAELLTIEASGAVVGPQAVYDRVEADLALIRASEPAVANIAARPSRDPSSILVEIEAAFQADVIAGTFDNWECPNELYGVTDIDTGSVGTIGWALLSFDGRYDIAQIVPDYTGVEGISNGEPNFTIGDGNDVCTSIAGDVYTYIFDAGSGDCPAGCISHTYWGFTVDGGGTVTPLGSFMNNQVPPLWFANAMDCTQWL